MKHWLIKQITKMLENLDEEALWHVLKIVDAYTRATK